MISKPEEKTLNKSFNELFYRAKFSQVFCREVGLFGMRIFFSFKRYGMELEFLVNKDSRSICNFEMIFNNEQSAEGQFIQMISYLKHYIGMAILESSRIEDRIQLQKLMNKI